MIGSWRLIEFECPAGHRFEELVKVYNRKHPPSRKCRCGQQAERVFSVPTVHTLETHMRGTEIPVTHGGYVDHALRDLKTGEYPHITSLAQKRKILKQRGFEEVGPSDRRRDLERSRGRVIVTP